MKILAGPAKTWPPERNEFILNYANKPAALARLTTSKEQPERAEVAQLAESMIRFWDERGHELKGILIACTFCATPLTQRKEPDFSETMIDFARHKNICLITTVQLLCIYRDLKLGKVSMDVIHQSILSSQGCLPGFNS